MGFEPIFIEWKSIDLAVNLHRFTFFEKERIRTFIFSFEDKHFNH